MPNKVSNPVNTTLSPNKNLNLLSISLDKDEGPQSPRCCGSTTANANVTKISTGKFERKSSGGSFKVINSSVINIATVVYQHANILNFCYFYISDVN